MRATISDFSDAIKCGFGDFEFLLGAWRVRHRQLRETVSHCNSWREFVGRSEAQRVLGGFGVVEEELLFEPHGTYRTISLSAFDVEGNSWSIWSYDSRACDRMEAPLRGKFERGVGVFLGKGTMDGIPISTRSLWIHCRDIPRLERAYSLNNGHTWRTNWTMEFHRSC